MTGLIQRMARRAQGNLPGIEPLVRSSDTATAALSTLVEDLPATTPSNPPRMIPGVSSTFSSPQVAPWPSPPGALPAQDNGPAVASPPPNVAIAEARTTPAIPLIEEERAAGETFAPAPSPAQKPAPNLIEAQAVKLTIPKNATEPALVEHSAAPSSSALVTPLKKTDLATVKRESNAEQRRPMEAAQVTPLEATTEHTEIHITIGSIELRAPRAEAPRPSAPFKPRVTLDDYLRRQSGANS